jgi:hypothetical protein
MLRNAWVATGDRTNWELGIEQGIWGVRPALEQAWNRLESGDRIFFHVIAPVGRIVGYGTVRTKFRQLEPLWEQEIREGTVIWPFRLEFDVDACLPLNQWLLGVKPRDYNLPVMAGLNRIAREDQAQRVEELLRIAEFKPAKPAEKASVGRERPTPEAEPVPLHRSVQQQLLEIGRVQRWFADPEYAIEGGRLDVVWRRVMRSVPTYAFEIQIGGEPTGALSKLKYAHQMWNSKVFLVTPEEQKPRIRSLVDGQLHELTDTLRIWTPAEVGHLHELKGKLRTLEGQLGI